MNKAVTVLTEQLHTLRAGRANPAVLDKIRVDYYGTSSKINEVAAVSVPEPRMLVIQPWDATLVKEIEKVKYMDTRWFIDIFELKEYLIHNNME